MKSLNPLRLGLMGVPATTAVATVASNCGSCGVSLNPWLLLATLAAGALLVATGGKRKAN